LWFASVWGILIVLMNREETEGPFTRLNTGQWKLLPVLDVGGLDRTTLENLTTIFDAFKNITFKNIHEQFNKDDGNYDNNRLEFDVKFLKALEPTVDEKKVRNDLLSLYERIKVSFDSWIGQD